MSGSSRWLATFPHSRALLTLVSVLAVSVGLCAGCSKGGAAANTEARMRKLLYPLCDYVEATTREGTGPPNEKGFKTYLAGLSKQKLADLQITNTEDLLISPRDQKPFVI